MVLHHSDKLSTVDQYCRARQQTPVRHYVEPVFQRRGKQKHTSPTEKGKVPVPNKTSLFSYLQLYYITPDRGPSTGGTIVTVYGANLTSASEYPGFKNGSLLCRFGGPEGKSIQAEPVLGIDAIRCVAPSNPREDGGTEVRINDIEEA